MTTLETFRPRWPWLSGDLQTIRNLLPGPVPVLSPASGRRFEIALRDGSGDRLAARFHPGSRPAPVMVLVPGLTGCEASRNVLLGATHWCAQGRPVIRLNLRGSPPGRSLARGHYHMDRVQDLADACRAIRDLGLDRGNSGLVVVGFSLGGALALRLASSADPPSGLRAVVAVSAPLDLDRTAAYMERPRNRLYERWLLSRLRTETAPVWQGEFPSLAARVLRARSIREFDDGLTAPTAGYRSAGDYYRSCSPGRSLHALRCPALVIHADDDPWVPVPEVEERPSLRVVVTRGGGHVGFHGRDSRVPWYLRAADQFVSGS